MNTFIKLENKRSDRNYDLSNLVQTELDMLGHFVPALNLTGYDVKIFHTLSYNYVNLYKVYGYIDSDAFKNISNLGLSKTGFKHKDFKLRKPNTHKTYKINKFALFIGLVLFSVLIKWVY